MIRPTTLAAWLAYLETLHPKAIAMGLDRVAAVHARMAAAPTCPVVTVTGTNGKGSTCAMLEAVLRCAGHRTGLYASPHLMRYNERVRIAGEAQGDDALVAAFNAVEDARGDVPLTYFEYGTLAALWAFARAGLDVMILEVGLGGRLDAVNVVDADVAVVTTIDLDHMDYLGPHARRHRSRKGGHLSPRAAGDLRGAGSPRVAARSTLAPQERGCIRIGRDFGYVADDRQWRYWGPGGHRHGLPYPALRGAYQLANAATALAVLDVLRDRLHVSAGAVRDGLVAVELPGRFQVLPGRPAIVLDVAHNPHAAQALAATLGVMGYFPETIAVFGILADKDIAGVVAAMRSRVDRWFVATLPGPRGASAAAVRIALERAGIAAGAIRTFEDVASGFAAARDEAGEADRIIVFGSFLTVAAALAMAGPRTGRAPRDG